MLDLLKQTEVAVYHFNGSEIRVIQQNDTPWFVAKDVAEILDYSDTQAMTRRLDPDEIQNRQIVGFGNRGASIINESGLYSAILGSTKPEAKAFKKWVTGEVLPSIRKHGGYIHAGAEESDETIMAHALQIAQATIERNRARLAEANREIAALAPDAEYARDVLAAANLHTVNAIAVHLGISAIRLNRFLVERGFIYKQGDIYCPSCKIRNKGLCDFHVVPYINSNGETMTREHLKWTEEGRRFIIELWNRNRKGA